MNTPKREIPKRCQGCPYQKALFEAQQDLLARQESAELNAKAQQIELEHIANYFIEADVPGWSIGDEIMSAGEILRARSIEIIATREDAANLGGLAWTLASSAKLTVDACDGMASSNDTCREDDCKTRLPISRRSRSGRVDTGPIIWY